MKTYYTCDACGLVYHTEAEALACEARHKAEEERQEFLAEQRESRWEEVNKAQAEYIEKAMAFFRDYRPERATLAENLAAWLL